jgi:hypothetical protein
MKTRDFAELVLSEREGLRMANEGGVADVK